MILRIPLKAVMRPLMQSTTSAPLTSLLRPLLHSLRRCITLRNPIIGDLLLLDSSGPYIELAAYDGVQVAVLLSALTNTT